MLGDKEPKKGSYMVLMIFLIIEFIALALYTYLGPKKSKTPEEEKTSYVIEEYIA